MIPALWLCCLVLLLPTESCRILCQVIKGEGERVDDELVGRTDEKKIINYQLCCLGVEV